MSPIPNTSVCLHSEFVLLLFLQSHRETDRFFSSSGVQLPQLTSGLLHFRRGVLLTSQVESWTDNSQGCIFTYHAK